MSEVLSDQLKRFLNIDATVRPLEYGVGIEAIVGCTYDMNTAGYSQKIMSLMIYWAPRMWRVGRVTAAIGATPGLRRYLSYKQGS